MSHRRNELRKQVTEAKEKTLGAWGKDLGKENMSEGRGWGEARV